MGTQKSRMEFKEVLTELLDELQLTQKQLADILGTTQGTVSKWLCGVQEPRYYQLQQMAILLSVSPETLLGLDYFPQDDYQLP